MADEIINKLGFDVTEALSALNRLDESLKAAGASFNAFGQSLDAFNSRAQAALATMRGLASAARGVAGAMNTASAAGAAPAQAAQPQPSRPTLWLPPGLQTQAQQAAQALAQVGQAGQQAGQQTATGMANAGRATNSAKQTADKFVVSFETLSRVVMTQLVVRAMSQIRNAIREATAEAIEFQQAIAEIRTIAPTIGGSFQHLSGEVAEFSKSFNIPLPDVSEGLYETISNQFASITERSSVMTAAMKLSRVAVMSYADSIRLVTSTLQAYGMASSEAEAVAAKFFTVINLGQIRGKELADTIGQVIPIAAQVGVSLDELNAAIISMTIGGLDAHKTMTGLRAAMSGFLKPSDDMKRVLREMGFTSPEQLIAAKGFQGALEAIADTSGDMASEIAKSFRNIRALTAELRLTQNGAKQVEEALVALGQSTPESLNKIFEEFRSTDAEKLTESINRMKVTLTQDLGSAIIEVLNGILQLAGGADNLSAIIQGLAMAAVPAAAALTGLAIAFAATNLAMGPIGWAITAVTAGMMLLVGTSAYSTASQIADIRKLASERRQVALEEIKAQEEKLRQIRETEINHLREGAKQWENQAATIRRTYFKALDDLKAKNQQIIDSDRVLTQSMISSQEKIVAAYRNAANQNLQAVRQSQQRQLQAEAQYADAIFSYRAKTLNDFEKAEEYMRRARQLGKQAADALSSAKTEEQVQAALAVQQRAEAAAQEAQSLAESTGNTILQQDAQRNLLGIYKQKIGAERELQQLQAKQAQDNAKRAAEEQARVNRMKVATKAILESLEAFDKTGAKTPQQLARQQQDLQKNLDILKKEWLGGQQVDVADLLAMDKLQQRIQTAIEGGVDRVEVQKFFASDQTFAQFRADIERGVGPVQVLIEQATRFSPELREEVQGLNAEEAMQHLSKRLNDSIDVIAKYRELADGLSTANQNISRAQELARTELSEWMNQFGKPEARPLGDNLLKFNFPEKYKAITDAVLNFATLAEKFSKPGTTISEADFKALNDAHQKYLETINPSKESRAKLEEFMHDAAIAADRAKQASALQGGVEALEQQAIRAQQEIPDIQNALEAAKQSAEQTRSATDQAALGAGAAANGLANVANMDMSGLVNQISMAAIAMQSLAIASANVQAPAVPMEYAAKGGVMRYLAAGGSAGTDVIPAMLSPGEFVMNAASTRKFSSQLIAMNAGVQPAFHSEGGSVTNIGDINVTVNGGGTSRQTARSIAAELRRELRRGTSTL